MKNQPYKREEILEEIGSVFEEVSGCYLKTESSVLYHKPDGKWSMVEQLGHLIKSGYPVASLLKMPNDRLAAFGKPDHSSRLFEALREIYLEKLAQGAVATPKFLPEPDAETDLETLLQQWQTIRDKLVSRLSMWSESDLDEFQVPHPVLGLLTVREMMLFTVFHTQHHLNAISRLKTEPA